MAQIALTPRKHLRTGHPLWRDKPFRTHPLTTSCRTDIAIVGAGISGALMAEAMSRRYEKVVVLDRRAPGLGSTRASTALLQFEVDMPLTELAGRIGFADAARAWRRARRATQGLIRLIEEERIVCGFGRRDALYLAGEKMGARGMAKEARARNRAGLDCEYLSGKALQALFGIDRTAAIFSEGAAIVDPLALTRGLLARARSRGARLFMPAEVRGLLATPQGVVLDAGRHFVEAKHAIFCTGYELLEGLPRAGVRITSSWAAATGPWADYPRWLDHIVLWEAASPYLYMRTTPDGRLLVGGEDTALDSPAHRANRLEGKAERLAAKTRRLLHVTPEWKHVWAGAFGESRDGLPFIDAVPGHPNCYAVMGFGGNGTVFAMLAAQILPGLLKGRPGFDADLFRFR
jgi:glycine/D-amino acid oxidase-like deaminating enzyme